MTERPMPSIPIALKTRSVHALVRLAFVVPLHHILYHSRLVLLRCGGALGTSGCADAETVAELAGDGLEVSHAAGTGGLPSLGLLAPVDCVVLIQPPYCRDVRNRLTYTCGS